MWRELILGQGRDVAFADPATQADLKAAARALGGPLPTDLIGLLTESDGVVDEYGLGLV